VKVFQPVSATMFGMSPPPQHEETPFDPRSPYAICKLAAYHLCRYYRQRHGMFVSCGIMFNHDSTRRHGDYLLHVIARQAVAIGRGEQQRIKLGGDKNTRVDVGCAREFMNAAIDMLQLDVPDDFVIGTGVGHSLGQMVHYAVEYAGLVGGIDVNSLDPSIDRDESYERPGEQPMLIADISKARIAFGFEPKRDSLQVLAELIDFYRGK
jgi:GDPmannose 4,6-dehydratase